MLQEANNSKISKDTKIANQFKIENKAYTPKKSRWRDILYSRTKQIAAPAMIKIYTEIAIQKVTI